MACSDSIAPAPSVANIAGTYTLRDVHFRAATWELPYADGAGLVTGGSVTLRPDATFAAVIHYSNRADVHDSGTFTLGKAGRMELIFPDGPPNVSATIVGRVLWVTVEAGVLYRFVR